MHSDSGDIAEFAEIPENDSLWYYATSNADNCLGSECPEIERCFVLKARKQALDADIVVINHHLYFSDLASKQEGFGELLPDADVLIFDEAHQLPDIAGNFYGEQVSLRQVELLCRETIDAELAEAPVAQIRVAGEPQAIPLSGSGSTWSVTHEVSKGRPEGRLAVKTGGKSYSVNINYGH